MEREYKMEKVVYSASDKFIKGECEMMCPEKEIIMRERNGLIHILEAKQKIVSYKSTSKGSRAVCYADHKKAVKSYSRSAAGQGPPDPADIRPPSVLQTTVEYLISEIVPCTVLPWTEVYEFVFDRLRAVRQDLVIQGLPGKSSVEILEPIVRFLAYSGYRLCEEPLSSFDPVINRQHLLECIKRLLVLYSTVDSVSRPDIEALYLVSAPGSEEVLSRAFALPPACKTPAVDCALKFSLACYTGNYVRAVRHLCQLPVLIACVAALHLPYIRRYCLQVMSTAFNSRSLRYPVQPLSQLLLFSSEAEFVDECHHYGLTATVDAGIIFKKDAFDSMAKLRRPTRLQIIDEKFDVQDITDLLLGHTC